MIRGAISTRGSIAIAIMLFVSLCAATVQGQLVTGNNAGGGGEPIVTTAFATPGPTPVVSFVPTGAGAFGDTHNGRGVLVLGNKVYYTELDGDTFFGPTGFIHAAPFNGGAGGADVPAWALSNPVPGCGIQDLAYYAGSVYALTGYSGVCPGGLQVFKWSLVTSGPWLGPLTL